MAQLGAARCRHKVRQIWKGRKLPCAECWRGGCWLHLPLFTESSIRWSSAAVRMTEERQKEQHFQMYTTQEGFRVWVEHGEPE